VAPTQAHIDVVAFDAIESHTSNDNYITSHQTSHHEHDSDDEKQTDHHHHCVDMSVSFAHLPAIHNYTFVKIPNNNEIVDFYTRKHTSKDLESLFQPPRVV